MQKFDILRQAVEGRPVDLSTADEWNAVLLICLQQSNTALLLSDPRNTSASLLVPATLSFAQSRAMLDTLAALHPGDERVQADIAATSLHVIATANTAYTRLLPALYIANHLEGSFIDAPATTQKLITLFQSPARALQYLERAAKDDHDTAHQVHNACHFSLPPEGEWTPNAWATLMIGPHHAQIKKLLPLAPAIEQHLGHPPASLNEALDASTHTTYPQAHRHPRLAELCRRYGHSNAYYENCLTLLASPKTEDHIPDLYLDARTLPPLADPQDRRHRPLNDRFYLCKLAPDDCRALLIGDLVGSCTRPGGAGEAIAFANVRSPDVGCYALFKRKTPGIDNDKEDEIIAKVTPWISQDGNLVFNSWQRIGKNWDFLCCPMLTAAAQMLLDTAPDISHIALGFAATSETPQMDLPVLRNAEIPRDPSHCSPDSALQYLLAHRSEMPPAVPREEVSIATILLNPPYSREPSDLI